MRKTMQIGIDTGKTTGVCIYNTEEKAIRLLTSVPIHNALEIVLLVHDEYPGLVHVRVEDARLREWVPYQKDEKTERALMAGAGSIKRDATIWEDFLKDKKISYEMVAPKNNITKLNAAQFERMTRYKGRSNEHSRDAAMLVYGL